MRLAEVVSRGTGAPQEQPPYWSRDYFHFRSHIDFYILLQWRVWCAWGAGRPVPKSKWTKNNAALPADDNLSMSQKPEMCKLQIQKARRQDAGEYDLELENASGKVNVPITVKVIGKLSLL